MEKEHILTTKITINGTFYDSQLYSGKLYLWLETNQLAIYNWNNWMLALNEIERPVYFEPRPSEAMQFDLKDLTPYLERILAFEEAPIDTAIFNHQLYFSDSTGFYSYSLAQLKATKKKLWDLPVLQINIAKNGRMALACGANGLYEYDNTKRFTDHTADEVAPSIYQLTNQYASRSEWSRNDLIQFGAHLEKADYICFFHLHEKQIILEKVQAANELTYKEHVSIEELPLSLEMTKPLIDEGLLFSFNPLNRQLKKEKQYRSKSLTVKAALSELNQQPPFSLNTIYIKEKQHKLTAQLNDQPILQIKMDFTKWRVYDRTLYYRNQLHVLTNNACILYLFTELIH